MHDHDPKVVWMDGWIAAKNGKPADANPHEQGTPLWQSWRDGYLDYRTEPRFEQNIPPGK